MARARISCSVKSENRFIRPLRDDQAGISGGPYGHAGVARSTEKPGLIAGLAIRPDKCLRARVRIADITRIVDTPVAALIGALLAIVEIAVGPAAVVERTIAVALRTLSMAVRWARYEA